MKILYSFLILTLLTGCSANRYLTDIENLINSNISLDMNVDSVEVFDHRTNISNVDIRIPILSYPTQLRKNVPRLDSTQITTVKNTIRQYCHGNGEKVKINVNIITAYKEFSATFASETERVYVEVQLDKVDSSGKLSFLCSSHAEYGIISSDAKYKRLEKLYLLAYKGAIASCLEKVAAQNKVPYINK